MALRTIIYIRKSSKDKDEKQIHSIPRQTNDIFAYVERHNKLQEPSEQLTFDPEKDVIKEDASGKIVGERPKFLAMIERIQKGKYDVLLCHELSRLSRNAVDTGTLVQLLEPHEKTKIAPLKRIQTKDKVFYATPTDKFTLGLFLMVAKFENDQRALNTKSGMANQKSKGETTNRAPLGYINCGEKKGRRWVELDPETCEGVRRLWELFATSDYAVTDIKEEADGLGITYLSRGKRRVPTESAYRSMLRNRYYCGEIKNTDPDTKEVTWVPGKHPAMVTHEEFNKVQLVLQSRGYKHHQLTKPSSIEAILDEILVCGKCQTEVNGIKKQTKMTFEQKTRYTCGRCKFRFSSAERKPCPECGEPIGATTKTDQHRYYRCCKKSSAQACSHDFYGTGVPSKNLRAEDIEKILDEHISRLKITDSLFEVLRRQLFTLWLQSNQVVVKQIKELEDQKKGIVSKRREKRRKVLEEEKTMTRTAREDAEFLMDEDRRDEEDIDDQIKELREQEGEQFEKAWQAMQALREAKSVFSSDAIDFEPKRNLVLSMISNLTIYDKKWTINWKKPFDAVAKASIAKRGRPKAGMDSDGSNLNWLPRLDSNQ